MTALPLQPGWSRCGLEFKFRWDPNPLVCDANLTFSLTVLVLLDVPLCTGGVSLEHTYMKKQSHTASITQYTINQLWNEPVSRG